MVKYGKTFRNSQIKGWEDKYFNYKKLKQKIKEILYEKENTNIKDLNDIEKNEIINKWIKEFTEVLDKEIRKIYLFFSKNEKKLYKEINIYLHIKEDYESYDLEDYLKNYQDLKKLAYLSLNISNYVYYNLKALLKILKKFDKKIIGPKDKDNQITNNLIIAKLEEQNSDILYLINFKMIDEVNVILEDLITCLNKQFKLHKNEFKTSVVEYLEDDNTMEENLIEQKANKIDINQAINIMDQNHKKIKMSIKNIDIISMEISKLFLPWKKFLRISGDVSSRLIQLSRELNSFGDSGADGSAFRNSRSIVDTISFSKQNSFNIILTLCHAFLYMFSLTIIIPTYTGLISSEKILTSDNSDNDKYFHFGLLMMMAPLGSLVSFMYESNLFMYTTKIPFVISSFGLIVGNFLYYISGYFNVFPLLFIGRLLIGIFNLRTHNKMYIINFLLKKDVSFYLTIFHTFSMFGLGSGFIINICLIHLSDTNLLVNRYTFGSLLCAILSFILSIISLIFFTEARSSSFNMTSMRSFINDPNRSFISSSSVNNDSMNTSKNNNTESMHNISNLIFEENINEEYSESLKSKAVMVNDINEQLGDFNKQNKYNDTNLVSLSISALAYKEREKLSSLLSSFLVYLIIIFTTKFNNETIFINLPIFVMEYNDKENNNDIGLWVIPFFSGISCLLVLFIEFALRNKNKIISEKNFLIILFFLNLINDLILVFLRKKYSFFYFIIIILALILCNIIEKYSTHFFFSIIPQDYIVCKIQGNIFINVFSMLAKVVSSILVIGLCKNNANYDLIIYLSIFILSLICLILFLIFYSDMRIKSISRIMNKLGKNDVKIATEV